MSSNRKIPSKEDFARAKAAMRKNDQGLSEVRERVLGQFKDKGLHEFFLLYSPKEAAFGAYIFYRFDEQISGAENSGLSVEIQNAVLDGLEDVGRGSRNELHVDFEFDSHERVEREYDGDYYARLH